MVRGFRTSALLGCAYSALCGVPVEAQTASAPAEVSSDLTDRQVQDIVVTGSRVIRDGFNAPTPITVLSGEQLQAAAPGNLSDAVNQLPAFRNSFVNASTGQLVGAAGGGAFLNLRGLSAKRVLVLLDGKRLPSSSVTSQTAGAVDTNLFPQLLVRRLDVVTGGASAAYGSDAVSGVVNFVLDKDFTGIKGVAQGGISSRGDNKSWRTGLAYATDFADRAGHFMVSAEYNKQIGITDYSDRGWAKHGYAMIRTLAALPQTSTANPTRVIAANVRPSNASSGGLITSGPLAGFQFVSPTQLAAFPFGTLRTATTMSGGSTDPDYGVNFIALPPNKRLNTFAHADYDIAPGWNLYAEGQYSRSKSDYRGLYSSFATHQAYTIFRDNAYLTDAIRSQLGATTQSFTLGRIDTDWGFHRENSLYDMARGVLGLDGKFGDWSLNAYFTHGVSRHKTSSDGNANLVRLFDAVDAVAVPAGTAGLSAGTIVCRSTLTNPTNGCVPLNVFGPNSANQAALTYILGSATQRQTIKQDVADIALNGEPFSLWAGPVSVGVGATYRHESAVAVADAVSESYLPAVPGTPQFKPGLTPALTGNVNRLPAALRGQRGGWESGNPGSLRGSYEVKEAFGEILVPLAKDWALAKSAELNAAVRYADYSTSGGVTSWKVGLTWEPLAGIRLRGTRSHDVRAANLAELYQGVSQANPAIVDAFRNNESNPNVITRNLGNSTLGPERSDTLTAGIVLQPAFLRGFSLSVDYYDIKIKDVITQLSGQTIADQCFAGVSQLCSLITRDTPATPGGVGPIIAINNPFLNAGVARSRGFDIEASYHVPLDSLVGGWEGTLDFRAVANQISELSNRVTGALFTTEAAGRVGALLPSGAGGGAKWGGTFNVTYNRGAFSLFVQERYIGPGVIDATVDDAGNPLPANAATNANLTQNGLVPNHVGAVWYSDATATYKFGTRFELFVTVNNLFDRSPPNIPTYFFYGTVPTNYQIYDIIGRTFTGGVRVRF